MPYKNIEVSRSTIIKDVITLKPSSFYDFRGEVFTTYHSDIYDKYLPVDQNFKHDRFSFSRKGILRGMHTDDKTWKLVTAVYGEIYLVVGDHRPDSPTYLKWDAWTINEKNRIQVLVPPGFINGHYCITDALFHYKMSYGGEYTDVKDQTVVMWNSNEYNIEWPLSEDPVMSLRDKLGKYND